MLLLITLYNILVTLTVFETERKLEIKYVEVKQRRIKTNHEKIYRSRKHNRHESVFCRIKNKSDIKKAL